MALDRKVRAAQRIYPSVQCVEPANRDSVAHSARADPERTELRKRNHPVLTPGQCEESTLALAPILAMVELRSSIRPNSAIAGHAGMLAGIACRHNTRGVRNLRLLVAVGDPAAVEVVR